MSDEWVFAIDDKDLNENLEVVFPKGLAIILVKKNGKIYAMSNKCAHMACGLESGILDGFTITCPCHDWKYDIRTGEFLTANEIKIPTYESKLSDGKILIKI
ncbi:MAG TPA: Rieske (2Fe-2S) protein [Candidatus Bathyarchaeia archaeon]|nr:Rieske (2Fe-2S) protein [Candidatus Bathyarchaeia archaeon]